MRRRYPCGQDLTGLVPSSQTLSPVVAVFASQSTRHGDELILWTPEPCLKKIHRTQLSSKHGAFYAMSWVEVVSG